MDLQSEFVTECSCLSQKYMLLLRLIWSRLSMKIATVMRFVFIQTLD